MQYLKHILETLDIKNRQDFHDHIAKLSAAVAPPDSPLSLHTRATLKILGSDREPGSLVVGPPVLKLAGIMQGTFLDAQEIKVLNTKTAPISLSNMGIAAVVPAYKLHDLLYSKELKLQRGF